MVATPHPLATAAGVEALRAGGTAVDAAVAANAMLAVVYCNACGLGGDAFALVWDPGEGRLHGFNGSGRSPAAVTIDAVRAAGHETMPQRGPLTIDVPGAVDAWLQLLDRFGRRSLADALSPAARTAEDGYELTDITARAIHTALPTFDETARAVFGSAGGPGDTFRQPLLAATLRAIADGGREAYYGGPIGEEIARAIQMAGGVMTADDIAAHRGNWVEPISTTYAGVEVATIPPNSQGITALMAFNVLSALDWPMNSPIERLHAQIEAIKVAWSERDRCVADPDRGRADPSVLLSPEHAQWLASRLSPERAHRYTPTNPPGGGTVYLCAADARRDDGQPDRVELHGLRLGDHGRVDRDHAPEPRRLLQPGPLASERVGAAVAHAAHADAGDAAARWTRGGRARRDGRRRPAADDGPARDRVARRRARCRRRSSTGRAGWSPRKHPGNHSGRCVSSRTAGMLATVEALEALGHEATLIEPRTPATGWAQVIRRLPDGSYEGGADPRADSRAAGT